MTMAPLSAFPLPLPPVPPAGYGWIERDYSELSTTVAFKAGIDQRDTFLGKRACIVCGEATSLRRCYIIPESETDTWSNLQHRGWIPHQAKNLPKDEPRNGVSMCARHQLAFDSYHFFIRFFPDTRRFVFVNYSGCPNFQLFHGKAIALEINDRHAPFPSLFIIHEMRVRGFNPFKFDSEPIATPDDSPWQDWIVSGGVFNNATGTFNRISPP